MPGAECQAKPEQQWKFEQERIVSRISSLALAGSTRSSHLVLEAQFDDSRPAMPDTPLTVGLACQVPTVPCCHVLVLCLNL